jgi:hypothetical protein
MPLACPLRRDDSLRGEWRADTLPARPEYLIHRSGDLMMRVRAILEPPHLAVVGGPGLARVSDACASGRA